MFEQEPKPSSSIWLSIPHDTLVFGLDSWSRPSVTFAEVKLMRRVGAATHAPQPMQAAVFERAIRASCWNGGRVSGATRHEM